MKISEPTTIVYVILNEAETESLVDARVVLEMLYSSLDAKHLIEVSNDGISLELTKENIDSIVAYLEDIADGDIIIKECCEYD